MKPFTHLLLLGILLSWSEARSTESGFFDDLIHGSGEHGSGGHGSSSRGGGGKSHGSGTGRGGSGDTGHPSISSGASSERSMNYFSGGGGNRITIPSGSASPFVARRIGGGTRSQVVGTRRFGSGYPYYTNNPQYRGVYGNPFPFGFWPLYWPGYGHSEEYGDNQTVLTLRPGGELYMVYMVASPAAGWNVTTVNGVQEAYWMVGDHQTVATVLSLLVDPKGTHTYACGVENAVLQPFNASDPRLPFHIQNVIQWYRSSSYALAYTGYNNSYASAPLNEMTTLDQSTPLPTEQKYSPYLHCINNTISASLPIMDRAQIAYKDLIAGGVVGLVLALIVGRLYKIYVHDRLVRNAALQGYQRIDKAEIEVEAVSAKHTEI